MLKMCHFCNYLLLIPVNYYAIALGANPQPLQKFAMVTMAFFLNFTVTKVIVSIAKT